MKLSDYIISFLKSIGIKHVFLFTGGAITHLTDSLYADKEMKGIVVHHEQAGAFAAEGYSRTNGNLGVVMATSGPGATNLITGIASAYFDSIPCIYITGQVNTYEYKYDAPVRQIGFQETDIVSIVKPITKDAFMVTDPERIQYLMQKAVYTAKSGRPGPVLIDIPMNIQAKNVDIENQEPFVADINSDVYASSQMEESIDSLVIKIHSSKRPVILIGGGIRLSKATGELLRFIDKTGIPVVSSLMGLDAFPHNHASFCGFVGAYGNRYANLTVANCDLLITIGSRLTFRQTGNKIETFARCADIVRVDIDVNELERIDKGLCIQSDAKKFLSLLLEKIDNYSIENIQEWLCVTQSYKNKYPSSPQFKDKKDGIDPNEFMDILSKHLRADDIICLDIGQNQIWAAQSLSIGSGNRMLVSGGMGPLGFSVPSAIGAYMAAPDKRIISISGDGGFQINIQELQTIKRNSIPLKIILMNNHCLGMIRHFQELYFDGKYYGTINGYDTPGFAGIAGAYRIKYYAINSNEDISRVLEEALNSGSAAFIEVNLPNITYVVPKLEYNKPIEDQNPLLDRDEFLQNMLIDPVNE